MVLLYLKDLRIDSNFSIDATPKSKGYAGGRPIWRRCVEERTQKRQRKSSTLNLAPSIMLFSVPIGDGLAPVIRHNDLSPIRMAPLLMASLLACFDKTIAPQHSNNIGRLAVGKARAHQTETSTSLAELSRVI